VNTPSAVFHSTFDISDDICQVYRRDGITRFQIFISLHFFWIYYYHWHYWILRLRLHFHIPLYH
jgi:hypothetical protein